MFVNNMIECLIVILFINYTFAVDYLKENVDLLIQTNQIQQLKLNNFVSTDEPPDDDDESIQDSEEDIKPWNGYTPGDVRCYCNMPVCVATGYMCKSEEGGCFTDLLGGASDVLNARHGCLERLSESEKKQCQTEPNNNGWSKPRHPRSLLLCCFKDMCNHIDSPDARSKLNDTLMSSNITTIELTNSVQHTNIYPTPSYSDAEVWFKAATIAVPICGALILLMLILLAVRILRSDANKLRGGQFISAMEYKTNVAHFDNLVGGNGSNEHCVHSIKKVPLYLDSNKKSEECCRHQQHHTPLLLQNLPTYENKNEVLAKFNAVKHVNMPPCENVKLYDKSIVPLTTTSQ